MSSKVDKLLSEFGANINDSISTKESSTDRFPGETDHGKALKKQDKYAGRTNNPDTGTREMALERIAPDPDQPRKHFETAAMKQFAANIRTHGVLQPISVRWSEAHGLWLIIDGERRFRASKLAGLDRIPCVFEEAPLEESSIRLRQLIQNCQREDLLPCEQATAFRALLELTGWTAQQLAKELNVAKGTVSKALALLSLPDAIRADVDDGRLAASVAYEVSKVPGPQKQTRLARQIVRHELSRDEAIRRARESSGNGSVKQKHGSQGQQVKRTIETARATITIVLKDPQATVADIEAALLEGAKQVRQGADR